MTVNTKNLTSSLNDGYQTVKKASDAMDNYKTVIVLGATALGTFGKRIIGMITDHEALTVAVKGTSAAYEKLNDNLNFSGDHIHLTGLEAAATANHFKTAAVAAYALSGTVRGIVNTAALEAIKLVGPTATKAFVTIAEEMLPVISAASRILGVFGLIVTGVNVMVDAVRKASAAMQEYDQIIDKTVEMGDISTGFFQRYKKAISETTDQVDEAIKALQRFADQSQLKLGGSDLQKVITQHIVAGNLKGNEGVELFKVAPDTESRFRAMVVLLEQAVKDGERFAAIDILSKFASPEMVRDFRANSQSLSELLDKMNKVKPESIIPEEELARAAQLKERFEEINRKLEEGILPQRLMVQLGLNFWEAWAGVRDVQLKFYATLKSIVDLVAELPEKAQEFGNAPFWKKFNDFVEKYNLNFGLPGAIKPPGLMNNESGAEPTEVWTGASQKGKEYLETLNLIEKQQRKVNDATQDTSKSLDEQNKQFDKILKSSQLALAGLKADLSTVGTDLANQEKLRLAFRLTQAAQQDLVLQGKAGQEISEKQKQQIEEISTAFGKERMAIETVKAAGKAYFDLQTVGLNDSEKKIADFNFQLHGNAWKDFMQDGTSSLLRLTDRIVSFRTTLNSIKQTTMSTKIDIATLNMPTDQATAYRLVQEKINQAILDRKPLNDAEIAQLRVQAKLAGDEARNLERQQLQKEIRFGQNTSFLSPEDVQIASQLRKYFNDDIPAALNSSYAAALRMNSAIQQISNSLSNNAATALTDFAMGTKSAKDAFTDFATSTLRAITEMIIKMSILAPLLRSIGVGGGGLLGFLGGDFKTAGDAGLAGMEGSGGFNFLDAAAKPLGSALGNVFNRGHLQRFAMGGIFSHPTLFPMAHGAGLMGEAGPEAVMPLTRGSDGKLGVKAQGGGGGGINIHYAPVIDARGADSATVARLAKVVADDKKNLRAVIRDETGKWRRNDPGALRA